MIRYPSDLGALLAAAGIPMIFGSSFPLLSLHGAFVALRWRMNDEQRLLASEFGEEFQKHKRETWRMIPPIY